MKKTNLLLAIVVLILFLTPALSFAQRGPGMLWRGSGGWGPGTSYNKMYDPKAVETVEGEIVSVSQITPYKGMAAGVHMTVRTEKETISVHLGPSWYLENQDIKLEPKDKIEVKGARVTFAGKPAIIAAEVKKDDEVLSLRDDAGFPVWAAWRRR